VKRKKRGVELQERDYEILKLVFSFRVVTLSQIARRHFPGKHKSIWERRVSQLCRDGFMKSGAIMRNGRMEKCLFPCTKAAETLVNAWRFEIDKPLFKSESPEHDVRLAELGLKLERLAGFRMFLPENLLQSSSELAQDSILADFVKVQADGALAMKVQNGEQQVFAVEMELTPKHIARYKDKLASYYLADTVDGILYVCGTQEIVNCLAEADEAARGRHESILHLALEKDAVGPGEKVIFHRGKMQTLVLS